jgi:hypothetical protein
MYIALPTFETFKPSGADKKLWKKLGQQQTPLEMLSEESDETVTTQYGKKKYRTIVGEASLYAGATEAGMQTRGLTSPEDFYSGKSSKKQSKKMSQQIKKKNAATDEDWIIYNEKSPAPLSLGSLDM